MERFWSKVKQDENGCWIWIARKDRAGYGEFRLNGKTKKAHRVSYELTNPNVDITKFCVLHKCDNPSCVRPDHLFHGSHNDNVQDKIKKGRAKYKAHNGSENGFSKLTEAQVLEIRSLKGKFSQVKIGAMFGVTQANVSMILLNKGWQHVK